MRASKRVKERGTEVLKDGRKIPYSRSFNPGDYVVTTYGSHEASDHSKGISLLVKHERRGKASWGLILDGLDILRGEASSLLQNQWGTGEAAELYMAVEALRVAFELQGIDKAMALYFRYGSDFSDGSNVFTLLDYFSGRNNISPGILQTMKEILRAIQERNPDMIHPSPIHNTVLQAIQTGDPRGICLLAKCIVAVDKNHKKKGTKRQKVANAVCDAANRLGKIPIWQEALEEYRNAGGDHDEGNFTRALRDAGFGWILPGRSCKRS